MLTTRALRRRRTLKPPRSLDVPPALHSDISNSYPTRGGPQRSRNSHSVGKCSMDLEFPSGKDRRLPQTAAEYYTIAQRLYN